MYTRRGPPEFDERAWSKFDFSRWHLDGIPVDAASAAFVDLAERLFASAEWREQFKARLPELKRQVLAFYREHPRRLEEEKAAVARDFDQRIAAAERRNEEFRKTVAAAAAPPVVQPSPDSFHLAVTVVGKKRRMGLPGLVVRLMDPRQRESVLAQQVTDRDGKVLLTLPRDKVGDLEKSDAALEILTTGGKSLQRMDDAVRIRLKQVETKVVALPDSTDIEAHQAAAAQVRSERQAHADNLASRIEHLKQEKGTRVEGLKSRLEQNQEIVAAIEEDLKRSEAPPEPVPPPPAPRRERKAPGDEEPSPAKKRRKR